MLWRKTLSNMNESENVHILLAHAMIYNSNIVKFGIGVIPYNENPEFHYLLKSCILIKMYECIEKCRNMK